MASPARTPQHGTEQQQQQQQQQLGQQLHGEEGAHRAAAHPHVLEASGGWLHAKACVAPRLVHLVHLRPQPRLPVLHVQRSSGVPGRISCPSFPRA